MIDENQKWLLPLYLLVDQSASMSGSALEAVNEGLMTLWGEVVTDPFIADKAWFSVIAFSDDAEVLVPLTDLQLLSSMPGCQTKGGTNFGNAFRKMKQVIDSDVTNLKAQEFKVIRPVVFFISGGEPTVQDWQQAHEDLVDATNPFRPHIFSFGIGSADGQTINAVATEPGSGAPRQSYLAIEGVPLGKVISEIFHLLVNLIIGRAPGGLMTPKISIAINPISFELVSKSLPDTPLK